MYPHVGGWQCAGGKQSQMRLNLSGQPEVESLRVGHSCRDGGKLCQLEVDATFAADRTEGPPSKQGRRDGGQHAEYVEDVAHAL